MMSYIIPLGFRFDPTDEELIKGFLYPKAMGFPLPWNGFLEKEVYGDNAAPWNVFSDIDDDESWYCNAKKDGGGTKKSTYVFTKVTKAALKLNAKRISRRVGCGTWSGQTGSANINDSTNGEIIGCTKMLSFRHSKTESKSSEHGHWIMHEYSLSGSALMATGERNNDLVLCKITKCVKESDDRRLIQQLSQFSFPVVDEIFIPATANKRPGEELLHQEEPGCKEQETCGGEGFLELEGCDMQFCSLSLSNGDIRIPTTAGDSIEWHDKQENGVDCKSYGFDDGTQAMLGFNFDMPESSRDQFLYFP